MPFCCGKRSAGICVVLGPKKHERIPANTSPGFLSLRPGIWRYLPSLAMKDDSDRLLDLPCPPKRLTLCDRASYAIEGSVIL